MAPKYPSIPEPTLSPESLRDAVLTIKQAFEVLTGQRGNQDYRAVLLPELTASDKADDAAIANLANNAAVRYDIAQSLSDAQVVTGLQNVRLGTATAVVGTDLNALTTPGLYDGPNLTNSPDGSASWFYIEVWRHSNFVAGTNAWCIQRATSLADGSGVRCWIRSCSAPAVWGSWVQTVAPDTWHPFAYQNGWVDYSAPFSPSGYRKLSSGLVVLRGLVQSGTAAGIAVLPAGYRPGIRMLFSVQTNPNIAARIDIDTDGGITHSGGSNLWISLGGISFLAEA